MPISIDEAEVMLDQIAEGFPPDLFKGLNGGIMLLPEVKYNTRGQNNELCILGEYHADGILGRYIAIYYGSLMLIHGHLNNEQMKATLESILKHEFRHHLETQAGAKDLEAEDERFIRDYLEKKARRKKNK